MIGQTCVYGIRLHIENTALSQGDHCWISRSDRQRNGKFHCPPLSGKWILRILSWLDISFYSVFYSPNPLTFTSSGFFPPLAAVTTFSPYESRGVGGNEQDQRICQNIPIGLVQFPQPSDNIEVKQIMPTRHEKNPESY